MPHFQKLEESVRAVFSTLRTKYRHTPLVLLSPLFVTARRSEWEDRHLDDRALAEALRVQFF